MCTYVVNVIYCNDLFNLLIVVIFVHLIKKNVFSFCSIWVTVYIKSSSRTTLRNRVSVYILTAVAILS